MRYLYSPDIDPTSAAFQTSRRHLHAPPTRKPTAKTMADLINLTLRDEMRRDERIVIFGEDVADCSRERYLEAKISQGQGRSLQAHRRLAVRLRI